MPDRRRGARSLALPVVVVALAAAAWCLAGSTGGVPPPPAARPPGADVVLAAETADVVAAERQEVAASASIYGRVTDATGVALADLQVEAVRQPTEQEPLRPGRTPLATSDGNGSFRFEQLEAGSYRVRLQSDRGVERAVTLPQGRRVRADLRLADDRCVVELVLMRQGETVTSGRVMVALAGGDTHFHVPTAGVFRFVAPVGQHRLCVCAAGATARSSPLRSSGAMFVAELPLEIPAGRRTLEVRLDVPVPSLEVTASDGGSAPFRDLKFTIAGTTAIAPCEATFEFVAVDGHRGQLRELPPGTWTVTAISPQLDAEPQQIEVPQSHGMHRMVITGRRAAVVRLDLRDLDGQPFPLQRLGKAVVERLPPLRSRTRERPCRDVAALLDPRPDGTVLGFAAVPLGAAEWSLRDVDVDGARHFLPFEPAPAPHIDVIGDGRDTLMLCVQPRALVELVACERSGRQSPRARMRVFLGETLVAPCDEPDRAAWQSCLPPGEYRVVIDYPDTTREHRVFVERDNLRLRLRR